METASQRIAAGRVEFDRSLARPRDAVELRAMIDLAAAVGSCPMDLNPISGGKICDLVIEVF